MKLYHYVHCPFCVRVRMGLGFLQLSYESVVVAFDDEETLIKLTGKKMLPILVNDRGVAINESLDILKLLDANDRLKWEVLQSNEESVNQLLNDIGSQVHSLCMPYWIWTPEFNDRSRKYFQTKKELKRGPFKQLIINKSDYIKKLNLILTEKVEPMLRPYFFGNQISIVDIMLASHLWGMYIFPEFQFSPAMHEYLQRIKKDCSFDYHQDFWL